MRVSGVNDGMTGPHMRETCKKAIALSKPISSIKFKVGLNACRCASRSVKSGQPDSHITCQNPSTESVLECAHHNIHLALFLSRPSIF